MPITPPPQLVHIHWHQRGLGGTLVTPFHPSFMASYQEAIVQHRDPDLVVTDTPPSLHCITGNKDLTAFWTLHKGICDSVANGNVILKNPVPGMFWIDPPLKKSMSKMKKLEIVAPPDPYADYDRAMGIVGKR